MTIIPMARMPDLDVCHPSINCDHSSNNCVRIKLYTKNIRVPKDMYEYLVDLNNKLDTAPELTEWMRLDAIKNHSYAIYFLDNRTDSEEKLHEMLWEI